MTDLTPYVPLCMVEKLTFHVNWLTYADGRAANNLGLQDYIAKCWGVDGEVDLLEADNDTEHSVTVKKGEVKDYDIALLAELKKQGGFEHYYLRMVMCDLCDKGQLPEGEYIISVSW